jgi:hypothetical protein
LIRLLCEQLGFSRSRAAAEVDEFLRMFQKKLQCAMQPRDAA